MTHVFKASRWTSGNLLFPTRIEITSEHVVRVKPRFFGSTEESISLSKVASVEISKGLLYADIRIDSTGGTNPILSHGHTKQDAEQIRSLLETLQRPTLLPS